MLLQHLNIAYRGVEENSLASENVAKKVDELIWKGINTTEKEDFEEIIQKLFLIQMKIGTECDEVTEAIL